MYVYFEVHGCFMWEMAFYKIEFYFWFLNLKKIVSDIKFDHVSNQWKAEIRRWI